MKNLKKFSVMILACAVAVCCFSCGDGESSSEAVGEALVSDNMGKDVNVSADEMPFGATMIDLYPDDVPIAISYEKRFMTEDEAKKISDYISAINSVDTELMEKTCYKSYLDYLVVQYENTDVADYLQSRHDSIASDYTGGEFDFDYILINSMMTEEDDNDLTGFSILDKKILEKNPSAKITSRKLVGVDILYTLDGDSGSYSLSARTGSDMTLYIYEIDGQIYIL